MDIKPTCETCDFFKEVVNPIVGQRMGECHGGPPQLAQNIGQDTGGNPIIQYGSMFPPIAPESFCGSHPAFSMFLPETEPPLPEMLEVTKPEGEETPEGFGDATRGGD